MDKEQLHRLIIENRDGTGAIDASDQSAMADEILEWARQLLVKARLSTLKRFSHIPPPHDEDWSDEFQKGVEHGVRISQEKLRFEIQRLRKQKKV